MTKSAVINVSEAEMGDEQFTVGIDLGDTYSNLCILDADGSVSEELRVRTAPATLRRQLASLPTSRVVLEVGSQSPWVSRLVSELGHDCIIANPAKVRMIAQSSHKTDRSDAEMLARLGRADPTLLSPVQHRSAQAQAHLAVIRSRRALVAARTLLINQVRGTVKAIGGRLRACDADHFAARYGEGDGIPPEVQGALAPVFAVIATLSEQIKAADAAVANLITAHYPVAKGLQQIPGVGPLISLTFVLTLDDPTRFPKSRAVGPYLGLTPRQRSSGDRAPELGISRIGDTYLRQLLVQGAHYILGYRGPDSDLRRWGLAKAQGGKNAKKRAVTAVARKLAVLLHHLWVTGEVYEPLHNAAKSEPKSAE
jgi:transposase